MVSTNLDLQTFGLAFMPLGGSCRRPYTDRPHVFLVKFQDESNDFQVAQSVIRLRCFGGDITLTETLELPGLTYAEVVFARRCVVLRGPLPPDVFEVIQQSASVLPRVATALAIAAMATIDIFLAVKPEAEPSPQVMFFKIGDNDADSIVEGGTSTIATFRGKYQKVAACPGTNQHHLLLEACPGFGFRRDLTRFLHRIDLLPPAMPPASGVRFAIAGWAWIGTSPVNYIILRLFTDADTSAAVPVTNCGVGRLSAVIGLLVRDIRADRAWRTHDPRPIVKGLKGHSIEL